MCDIQDDLSSIPDASLLLTGLDHQSTECLAEIAHHEYFPTSRGHDPSPVHHGPAAENPCNTIMQRYLPLEAALALKSAYVHALAERGGSHCACCLAGITRLRWACISIDLTASLLSLQHDAGACPLTPKARQTKQLINLRQASSRRDLDANAGAVCSGFHLPLSGHFHPLHLTVSSPI